MTTAELEAAAKAYVGEFRDTTEWDRRLLRTGFIAGYAAGNAETHQMLDKILTTMSEPCTKS
jgi:hypothetical protein